MSDNPWHETRDTALDTASPQVERALDSGDMMPAREGLPRNFRMRADRHYVDQLAATSADQPVRMLPLAQLDSTDADSESDLRPLIESIRAHGVVHPLLVRRRDSGFVVVAGRKRLRAARALRLPTVPCLVREIADSEAAALSAADNVTVRPAGDFSEGSRGLAEAQRVVAGHLANVRGCVDMWSGEATGLSRPAVDLLKANAWRASALLHALDLISDAPLTSRPERSLASIIDETVQGFETEMRLSGISLRTEIRDDLSSSGLGDEQIRAGLSGALLATLPLVERSSARAVVVRASSAAAGAVALDVLLPAASVSRYVASHFFDADLLDDRPGGHAAAIGALAAKTLAERHNGTATFEPFERGYRLSIVMPRRS